MEKHAPESTLRNGFDDFILSQLRASHISHIQLPPNNFGRRENEHLNRNWTETAAIECHSQIQQNSSTLQYSWLLSPWKQSRSIEPHPPFCTLLIGAQTGLCTPRPPDCDVNLTGLSGCLEALQGLQQRTIPTLPSPQSECNTCNSSFKSLIAMHAWQDLVMAQAQIATS